MSLLNKILHRFTEKQEKKILLNEQSARLTVFKDEKKEDGTNTMKEVNNPQVNNVFPACSVS